LHDLSAYTGKGEKKGIYLDRLTQTVPNILDHNIFDLLNNFWSVCFIKK